MNITLDQVKADIKSGKSKMIYYSTHTLWWTHLGEDLKQATKTGRKKKRAHMEAMIRNPRVPESHKEKMKNLLDIADSSDIPIPVDPTGAPLFETDDCDEWIRVAENKPDHFGAHGLDAFMKSHHQNCEGQCFSQWETYNTMIDYQTN